MAEKDRITPNVAPEGTPEPDRGDVTPPHGDELRAEATFGRTDRYANRDDPEAEAPVFDNTPLVSEEELNADAQRRRMEQIDDAAAEEARIATRRREHSTE